MAVVGGLLQLGCSTGAASLSTNRRSRRLAREWDAAHPREP